jgi:hypothetical protein
MGVSGQRHAPAARFTPFSTHWIRGWVGPRAALNAETRRKILCPCRGSNPDRPARSQTLYHLSYRGSYEILHPKKLKLLTCFKFYNYFRSYMLCSRKGHCFSFLN